MANTILLIFAVLDANFRKWQTEPLCGAARRVMVAFPGQAPTVRYGCLRSISFMVGNPTRVADRIAAGTVRNKGLQTAKGGAYPEDN